MKTYIFSFVGEENGKKIIKDIREKVSVCEDLQGVKERHAMALEIREVQE